MKKIFMIATIALFSASVIASETQVSTETESATESEMAYAGDSDWEFVKTVELVGIAQIGQTFSVSRTSGDLYHQSGTGYQYKVVKGKQYGFVGNNNLRRVVNDDDPRKDYNWTVTIGGIDYYFNM